MPNTKLTQSGVELQSAVNKAEKLPVTSSADENKVLKVDSQGNIITGTDSAGMSNPMTTQGDLIVGGANGTPTRLAEGERNTVLQPAEFGSGLEWKPYLTKYFFVITNVSPDADTIKRDINVSIVTKDSGIVEMNLNVFRNLLLSEGTIKTSLMEPDYQNYHGTVGTNIRPISFYGDNAFQYLSSIIANYRRFTLNSDSDFVNLSSEVI